MQQLVRVQKCNDDQTVLVIPVQLCEENCQSCAGCKSQKLQKVKNPINATCGQVVLLTTNTALRLLIRASFLSPMVLLLLGFVWQGSAGGILGLTAGLLFALWMTTKEKAVYTIKRPKKKGDNDLD